MEHEIVAHIAITQTKAHHDRQCDVHVAPGGIVTGLSITSNVPEPVKMTFLERSHPEVSFDIEGRRQNHAEFCEVSICVDQLKVWRMDAKRARHRECAKDICGPRFGKDMLRAAIASSQ